MSLSVCLNIDGTVFVSLVLIIDQCIFFQRMPMHTLLCRDCNVFFLYSTPPLPSFTSTHDTSWCRYMSPSRFVCSLGNQKGTPNSSNEHQGTAGPALWALDCWAWASVGGLVACFTGTWDLRGKVLCVCVCALFCEGTPLFVALMGKQKESHPALRHKRSCSWANPR